MSVLSVTGVRRHFSFFYEHLRRCKYCPEPYSMPEEVVQHCATSHRMFFLFLDKALESTTYHLINKHLIVICLFDLTLNV